MSISLKLQEGEREGREEMIVVFKGMTYKNVKKGEERRKEKTSYKLQVISDK